MEPQTNVDHAMHVEETDKGKKDNDFAKEALTLMPWIKEYLVGELTYGRLLSLEARLMRHDKLFMEEVARPLWAKMSKDKTWHAHPLHEELEYYHFVNRLVGVLSHKVSNLTPEEFEEWEKSASMDTMKE